MLAFALQEIFLLAKIREQLLYIIIIAFLYSHLIYTCIFPTKIDRVF